jgi:serine/threonine-protein kinase RsbW
MTFAHGQAAAPRTIDALQLAASEAATNVVMHAYRDSTKPGTIDVSAERDGRELRVIISDGGSGLRPRTDSPGLGLGLSLIATMADDVVFSSSNTGGAEVRMVFLIDHADA